VLSGVHRASHLSGLALLQHSKAFKHMWLIHLPCTLLLVCYLSDGSSLMSLYVSCITALAAVAFLRSLAGFGFPLFAPAMYKTLGYGIGDTVLAVVGIVVGCPAYV
jgi:hypothetical protein